VLLAEQMRGGERTSTWSDMDEWGYSFRLGNARVWFEQDADDARAWLQTAGIIDAAQKLTGRLRAL
jgi:hypothetical protein